ncbi:hypothetical protein [Haloferax sp. YSSS75]|uniref:hypothetical protein n=1 Tax=Haloferax sp. YSSS75 TaxID=3388564 RepID=UPI00398CFC36
MTPSPPQLSRRVLAGICLTVLVSVIGLVLVTPMVLPAASGTTLYDQSWQSTGDQPRDFTSTENITLVGYLDEPVVFRHTVAHDAENASVEAHGPPPGTHPDPNQTYSYAVKYRNLTSDPAVEYKRTEHVNPIGEVSAPDACIRRDTVTFEREQSRDVTRYQDGMHDIENTVVGGLLRFEATETPRGTVLTPKTGLYRAKGRTPSDTRVVYISQADGQLVRRDGRVVDAEMVVRITMAETIDGRILDPLGEVRSFDLVYSVQYSAGPVTVAVPEWVSTVESACG